MTFWEHNNEHVYIVVMQNSMEKHSMNEEISVSKYQKKINNM